MYRLWQFLSWFCWPDDGLIKTGRFSVEYPDGKRSRGLDLGYAGTLRSLFGGRIHRIKRCEMYGNRK